MKKVLKVLGILVLIIILAIAGLGLYIQLGYDKKFPDTPYPQVQVTTDSATIAWGKYLVYGPAHCAVCHVDVGQEALVDAGQELPLIGGYEINVAGCIFRTRNITSDKETGIGNLRDEEIARTLRYNVNHNHQALVPFMPFMKMSQYDMNAIISYLRTLEPVKHEVKPSEFGFMPGKLIKTFFLKPPPIPAEKPVDRVTRDTTIEYGEYMATCVANCYGCHTAFDVNTAQYVGKPFAGGFNFDPAPEAHNYGFISPNITTDETGRLNGWNETTFLTRMRGGRIHKGSPMPWGPYSRMDDIELKAIFKYLQTVQPVKNLIEKTVFAPGEKMPPFDDWSNRK